MPAERSTADGSSNHARPQRKAAMFASTATPLSSIARSTAGTGSGTAPACTAAPSTRMFAVAVEPTSPRASAAESRITLWSRRVTSPSRSSNVAVVGRDRSGWVTISPVGTASDALDEHGRVTVGAHQVAVARRHEQVECDDAVDAGGVGMVRCRCFARRDADVAHDGSGLLRQARLIEPADASAGEHRRGADHLADGDDPGTADTGEPDREPIGVDQRRSRLAQDGNRGQLRSITADGGRVVVDASPSRTTGSRPSCTTGRGCSSPGGCASCDPTVCRSAAPTDSC